MVVFAARCFKLTVVVFMIICRFSYFITLWREVSLIQIETSFQRSLRLKSIDGIQNYFFFSIEISDNYFAVVDLKN